MAGSLFFGWRWLLAGSRIHERGAGYSYRKFQYTSANCIGILASSGCLRPSSWNNSTPTGPVAMKFGIWGFLVENLSRKFEFDQNLTRMTGILLEHLCTFTIIFRWSILELSMFRTHVVEKIKTPIVFLSFFIFLWFLTIWFIIFLLFFGGKGVSFFIGLVVASLFNWFYFFWPGFIIFFGL